MHSTGLNKNVFETTTKNTIKKYKKIQRIIMCSSTSFSYSTESGLVIGPSNVLFAGMYVCTFQPGKFAGWVSEGVN